MADSVHYPDVGDVRSRRQPIHDRHRIHEPFSESGGARRRLAKGGVILGTILGVGAGVAIIALLRAGAPSSDVTLIDTPPLPAREPMFSINPGYEAALAIPAGNQALSGDEAQHVSVTPPADQSASDEASAPQSDSATRASDPAGMGSGMYDERENVSGVESDRWDERPIDTLGRDTNLGVPDLDVGDIDVQGPGGARRDSMQRRLDMAPTETAPSDSFPGVGTKPGPELPVKDNPY